MTKTPDSLLIDTHILIWLMNGDNQLSKTLLPHIESVVQNSGRIFVSAISIWEIAMLESKGRIQLKEPVNKWIKHALSAPCVYLAELSPDILIESTHLPGNFHQDPADRMIVASARVMNIPLITQDNRIVTYANQGYVNCL